MEKSKFPASWQVIGRALVDWWDGWFDLLTVVVVWLLAQLSIVFGPPATFGLYYVVYQLTNGESTGVRGLVEGGRKFFASSWLWAVINLVVLATIYVNIQFYSRFVGDWRYLLIVVFGLLLILWLVSQFYALAFIHEQQDPRVLMAIRNGVLLALATPFFSFLLIVLSLIVAAFSAVLLLPIFLGVPAIIPLLGVRAVQDRLVAYGIRQREKTPKELEREAGSRISIPERRDKE